MTINRYLNNLSSWLIVSVVCIANAVVYAENLLTNGSFELGLRHGWATGGKWIVDNKGLGKVMAYDVPVDTNNPFDGNQSLKLPLISYVRTWRTATHTAPGGLRHMMIPLDPNRPYVLSAYVRSDAPDAGVTLYVGTMEIAKNAKSVATRQVKVTDRWQRVTLPFVPPPHPGGNEWGSLNPPMEPGGYVFGRPATARNHYYISISIDASGKGSVWIDAIQLEQSKEATEFAAKRDVEVGLSVTQIPEKYGNIFLVGEPLAFEVTFYNFHTETRLADCEIRIFDTNEKVVWTGSVNVGLVDSGVHRRMVKPKLAMTGTFRAEVYFTGNDKLAEEMVFSILPAIRDDLARGQGSLGSRFYNTCDPDTWMLNMFVRMGVSWIRILGQRPMDWSFAEPSEGNWVWSDAAIKKIHDHGIEILSCLRMRGDSIPKWANTGGRHHSFPVNDVAMENFVEKIVAHYKPWVKYWEILNEPDKGVPERGLMLLTRGNRAAKRADPDVVIVGPCANSPRYVEPWLKGNGLDQIDIFSYHYSGSGRTDDEQIKRCLQAVEYSQRDGKKRTIWNTEENNRALSFPFYHRYHELRPNNTVITSTRQAAQGKVFIKARRAAAGLARLHVINLAHGSEKVFYWSLYPSPRMVPAVLHLRPFEYDGALAPRGAALALAARILDGASPMGKTVITPSITAYLFRRGDKTITALWRRPAVAEDTEKLGRPKGFEIRDMMGNIVEGSTLTVGESPIYLIGKKTPIWPRMQLGFNPGGTRRIKVPMSHSN